MAKRKSETQLELSTAQEFSVSLLKQAKWFYDLTVDEQQELERDTVEFTDAVIAHGMSGLKLGAVLHKINLITAQYGLWEAYLSQFRFSESKGYRLLAAYRNVMENINETILEQAMLSGIDLIGYQPEKPYGKYTEAMKSMEPPAAPGQELSPTEARLWLMQIDEKQKELRKIFALDRITKPVSIEDQLKAALIPSKRALSKIVVREDLENAVIRFCGMLIQSLGLGPVHEVEPQAVPEGWLRERGRPFGTTKKQLGSGEQSAA
jgi:hypothetical protein